MYLRSDDGHTEPKVLIVGAGPVGMFLAVRLRMAGISAMIIDKRPIRDCHSKALTINPATLQALSTIGIADAIEDVGVSVSEIAIQYEGSRIASMDLSSLKLPVGKFTMLPQFRSEEFLENRLVQVGGGVQRGVELVSIVNDEAGCHVGLRNSNGSVSEIAFDIVVGADGFRSDVRQLSGIENSTAEKGIHFAMADAPIEWDGPRHALTYAVTDEAFMVAIPLTETLHRIVVSIPSGPVNVSGWTQREFQDAINLIDCGLRIGSPIWQSSASLRTQLAKQFLLGKVVLAGDASHGFSPIGGLGMATGIADAMHLSNALIAHFATAEMGPLAEYSRIRHRISNEVMRFTSSLTDIISRRDRTSMLYRAFVESNQNVLNSIAMRVSGFTYRTSF
jgi:2-polyprenyl-6-methoxyphenol hydroxylase-like FAD-dependent oxidoreductase